MDVVKRHIQKLRGRVEISTRARPRHHLRLRLPLTLAIIDGLLVGVGAERYIVPIFAVREAIRPTGGMVSTIEGRRRDGPGARAHSAGGAAAPALRGDPANRSNPRRAC